MKSERKLAVFRFNMVEIALALIILAIGLSSVMVLFPVGLRASRSSVADNNLADVAERVAAFLQAKYTTLNMWDAAGVFKGESPSSVFVNKFVAEDNNGPYDPSQFTTKADDMDGLFESSDYPGYYVYRQYSDSSSGNADNDRAVDFEAMIRVGWDDETLTGSHCAYYYNPLDPTDEEKTKTQSQRLLSKYTRANINEPLGTNMNTTDANSLVAKFYRPLVIEISWPADVPWANREKRIFRMEMFNENFVPYPPNEESNANSGGGTP